MAARWAYVLLAGSCWVSWNAAAAELQLRESLLRQQASRVTAEVRAEVSQLGKQAHPLDEDCDQHVPLRSEQIKVPLLAEIKNACSRPPGEPRNFWAGELARRVGQQPVATMGIFRVWLEHPPGNGAVQSEAKRVPAYKNSNPDHMVELHPLLKIGDVDFHEHIGRIESEDEAFEGYGFEKLRLLASRTLEIGRTRINGTQYVRLISPKMGFNHWTLTATIRSRPELLADGARLRLDVIDETGRRPPLRGHTAVTAVGTAVHERMLDSQPGDTIQLLALGRIAIPPVLAALDTGATAIRMPIEFALLSFEVVR